MKGKILDLLKGIPIGIANVIPGFSGGTMAVILNVYERLITALSEFLHHPIKVIKNIWALFLGVVIGVIVATKLIVLLLSNFPIPTTLFFVGLVIGSIPNILFKANQSKVKAIDIIVCFVCVLVIIVFSFIREGTPSTVDYDFKTALLVFFLSVIAAAAMVIPGVSGSLILLALGYYDFIWKDLLGTFINAVISLDFAGSVNAFLLILPFILGVIFGIVFISKLIKLLIGKYPQTVYYAIFGLLVASPFAIIYGMYREYRSAIIENSNFWGWIIGIISITVSAYLVNYLSKFDIQKKD
ncbi:MAG: DUF368 domain-containing protein [Bacilli bacterium]|nr:DUF368 domain-containing protein [Bacilli bacterium]MDD4077051.1 DUF368 domain-containing protein [Bacilli bacterium]MDD4388873.1 DUF368 domain-containing protein [Bacilli bacterium]